MNSSIASVKTLRTVSLSEETAFPRISISCDASALADFTDQVCLTQRRTPLRKAWADCYSLTGLPNLSENSWFTQLDKSSIWPDRGENKAERRNRERSSSDMDNGRALCRATPFYFKPTTPVEQRIACLLGPLTIECESSSRRISIDNISLRQDNKKQRISL
ncbi:hypothetical protein PROFUN_01909 [Planoprotostelium fungivorum]|uniref:Uncharacterized protein n=1 Tax=Planoprotostelium fungivorum TaxID=1890364 RepID=A0A2P6NZ24_9EUKA|nr:hypothetical protein PROFUN_01909 [Planoprotostelium fungivorum]